MTSTTANVDYIRVNFEYPVLTKISGKPDYESLKAIKNELKAIDYSWFCQQQYSNEKIKIMGHAFTLVS